MKLVSFISTKSAGLQHPRLGLLTSKNKIFELTSILNPMSIHSMDELVGSYKRILSPILNERAIYAETPAANHEMIDAKYCRLLAPIQVPKRNIFCVGKNYSEHVHEIANKLNSLNAKGSGEKPVSANEQLASKYPSFFTKAPNCVIGPEDFIPNHSNLTKYLDYEVEVGMIIGTEGVNINKNEALNHVMGITIGNDVTARDIQRRHNQWFKGKTLDGTCPLGPCIVPLDSMSLNNLNLHNLSLKLKVNDELRQDGNTSKMIFTFEDIIYHLSQGFTLRPGDVILTGTPSGVGYAMEPPKCLQPGDKVEAEVEGIGSLINYVSKI